MRETSASAANCTALFCDGRNDMTRSGRPGAPVKVHNISVNMHPDDVFLGHFTCSGRHTGQALADQLANFLEERGIDMAKVQIIGGDGTNPVVGS